MRFSTYITATILSISISAVAQIKVCIGGNLDYLSTEQVEACKVKSSGLQREARARGAQGDWHFVVVCDEQGWKEYATFTGNDRAAVMRSTEQTDVAAHITFIRGSKLQANDPRTLDALLATVAGQPDVPSEPAVERPVAQSNNSLMARR